MNDFAETQAGHDTGIEQVQVRARIRQQIARDFRDGRQDGLLDDTPLVSAGLVDSAGVVHLVEWLEGAFEVRIADDDVTPENFDSIAALGELVGRLRG